MTPEEFIKEYTNNCSNELDSFQTKTGVWVDTYHEWLTPDQALQAVEIAREETLLEVAAWIKETFIFSKQAKEDFSQTFNIMKDKED